MSNLSSRPGSVGNENVDSKAIPTELFEMDTENKLLKLKDGWTYEGKFTNVDITGSINATGLTTETVLENTDEVILSRGTNFFKFLWSGVVSLVRDLVYPIGTVYTQFPGKSDPGTLFGGVWDNISSEFPGDFFRAEGGAASTFNSGEQADLVKAHGHTAGQTAHRHLGGTKRIHDSANGQYGAVEGVGSVAYPLARLGNGAAYVYDLDYTNGSQPAITVNSNTGAENRPKNRTIRIFQRTA